MPGLRLRGPGDEPISASRALAVLLALVMVALLALLYLRRAPPPVEEAPVAVKAPTKAKKAKRPRSRPAAEKACLPPPTEVGPEDMVASAGMDPGAIRTVMRAASQASLPCFGDSPSVTVQLSILVACTGRVATVDVEDDGGVGPEVQSCIQEALKAADFPAHALPDGERFGYPLKYTAPG